MDVRRTLEADLFSGARTRFFHLRLAKLLWRGRGGPGCIAWVRLAQYHHRAGRRRSASRCAREIERRYGCYIAPSAEIGPGVRLPHPVGIVIGIGANVGAQATIFQHVTIGARRLGDMERNAYPTIGKNAVIYAGAAIIGDIRLGDGCVVGANAVVTRDIPANDTAVGAPARILPH